MFNKLHFVNYSIGMGGEFFSWLLTRYSNNIDYDVIYFNNSNQYSFHTFNNKSDLLFSDGLIFILDTVLNNCKNLDDYLLNHYCGGDKFMFKQFVKKRNKNYSKMMLNYNVFVHDIDHQTSFENLKNFINGRVLVTYNNFKQKQYQKFYFQPIHYNNRYDCNLDNLFVGSKTINLISNQKLQSYFCLLGHFKLLNYFIDKFNIEKSNIDFLVNLIEYYIDNYQFHSKQIYPNQQLYVNVDELYFNKTNIDVQLTEYLQSPIKLDYNEIDRYNDRNLNLMINMFNFDINKHYSTNQIKTLLSNYILKVSNV